ARESALSAALTEVRALESSAHALERAIDAARNALVNAADYQARIIPGLERRAAEQKALEQQLAQVRQELADLDALDQRRQATQSNLADVQQQAAEVLGENSKLKEEMDELKKKLVMLEQ